MDKKALSILKKHYGGTDYSNKSFETLPSKEDLDYSIAQGTMFEKSEITHDAILVRLRELSNNISMEAASKAFLYSLSTGQKEYRAALASCIYAITIPVHDIVPADNHGRYRSDHCAICGFGHRSYCSKNMVNIVDGHTTCEVDWNRFSCDRLFPSEHTELCQPEYALLDLQEFLKLPPVEPNEDDFYIFNRILGTAAKCTYHNRGNALVRMIKQDKIINATGTEIQTLLGILGICGVFEGKEDYGYLTSYINFDDRKFEHENDRFYPFSHWRGSCGINFDAINNIFESATGRHWDQNMVLQEDVKGKISTEKTTRKTKNSAAEKHFTPGKHIINLTNDERRYLALNEMKDQYEHEYYFSKTNLLYKRTTLVFLGDIIKKVLHDTYKISDDGKLLTHCYWEYDTNLMTQDRETLIPITVNGKKKSINPTNVGAMPSDGCYMSFSSDFIGSNGNSLMVTKGINSLAIGEEDSINQIMNDDDFHTFMKWYMDTCPADYFEKIEYLKSTVHKTVKFKPGDIFRCEYDRFHYCYGLIIGKPLDIKKWGILPERHSFYSLMQQPIMIRMYDFITTNKSLSAKELDLVPLRNLEICVDNEIIWGKYPVIAHKDLVPSDIQFHIQCYKNRGKNKYKLPKPDETYDLIVEWGTATAVIQYSQITVELREILKTHSFVLKGIGLGIPYHDCGTSDDETFLRYPNHVRRSDLLNKENEYYLKILFRCLGIPEDTDFDQFAEIFGGITKKEYIDRL